MPPRFVLVGLVALTTAIASAKVARAQPAASELEILVPETVWGFDGKAVKETFTPLSILVQNSGSKMATGVFRLKRMVPLDSAQEPSVETPFDVPPFEERWVQMPVFIPDDYIPFELSWGPRPKQKVEIPQARTGDPAVVLITNPNDRPRSTGTLRRFRAQLFPASLTATDGLGAVFLESVPDFQGARLQAFLEWLNSGGTVVILHDDQQQFPKFPTALAMLNEPKDSFAVGAGRVRRLALEARDIDDAQCKQILAPDGYRKPSAETTAAFADPNRVYNGNYPWNRDRGVLEKLEAVARFHRRWWLIYPLALLYVLAIFPGSFAVAQSPKGVRRFYIVYFALAIAFSWAFKTLGGVGGGDGNRIRSATIAQQISPGLFDCTQWNCLAAVSGGWYSISHEGSGRLYAPYEEFEIPHGLITTGADAKYGIDIPVASTRTAIARFRTNATPVTAEIRKAEFTDQRLSNCSVAFNGLPRQPLATFVCHRNFILRLKENQGAWETDQRRSMATSIYISNLDRAREYSFVAARLDETDSEILSPEFYTLLERQLIGNAFDIHSHVEPWSATLQPGRVRVMALVEADRAFAARAEGFDDVQGCVLYVLDLPITEN